MNIKKYFEYATKILKESKIEAPAFEAGVMLCHCLRCDKAYLYSHDDRELNGDEQNILENMLLKRADNVPLQYIIGETEFMSLSFYVTEAVLIPRQDTEILVEKCIDLVNEIYTSGNIGKSMTMPDEKVNGVKVLDLCTGSGCIAISIAYYCQNSYVTACDISEEALSIAAKNSDRIGAQNRLEFRCGDLFSAIRGNTADDNSFKFDLIVSNPPYIETDIIAGLQKEVKNYEPMLALDGGSDGLAFYRRIIEESPNYLISGGVLAFEIGYNQGFIVSELMSKAFKDIKVYKDLSGNDRVVLGKLNQGL